MSTVDERFDKIVEQIESVLAVLKVLKDMGIYGRDEMAAGVALMATLERAMRVLDPERAIEYIKTEMEKTLAEKPAPSPLDNLLNELQNAMGGNPNTGLYL